MARKNAQGNYSKTDSFGMLETSFGNIAKTTKAKFTLTKTAAGLDTDISDAVKPSGAAWSKLSLTLKDTAGNPILVKDLSVAANTVTTAVTDAEAKAFSGEILAELQLVTDGNASDVAIAYLTYGELATSDVVRSIGNEA